ncbi:hypothetical protein MATR_00680 [Marivirga tractuosa]|nr:hypothetical protein MATR_00680 [Marivirga tractuosa]
MHDNINKQLVQQAWAKQMKNVQTGLAVNIGGSMGATFAPQNPKKPSYGAPNPNQEKRILWRYNPCQIPL